MGGRKILGGVLVVAGALIVVCGSLFAWECGDDRIIEYLRNPSIGFGRNNYYRLPLSDVILFVCVVEALSLGLGIPLFRLGRSLWRSGSKSN